jgi:hypothetical protein
MSMVDGWNGRRSACMTLCGALALSLAACCAEVRAVDPAAGGAGGERPSSSHATCGGACSQGEGGAACAPGAAAACYTGPAGTLGIGACRSGLAICNEQGTALGPCDGEITPEQEICGNDVDEDCDGALDDGCPDLYPWVERDGYYILAKDDGVHFAGVDCPGNFFGADVTVVESVPFAVGPHTSGGRMTGLPPGGATVPAPAGGWPVHRAYLIFPGGRCSSQSLSLTFNYAGGGSASTAVANVTWDCNEVPSIVGPDFNLVHQGHYGGPCCDSWYWGEFSNANPAAQVESITVNYADGCNGMYTGQMWALTID